MRTTKRRAFTLLEVVVAMAMTAILAGSLYAVLQSAFKARASALTATDSVRQSNLTMEIIATDLRNTVVPGGTLAGTFVGQSGQSMMGGGMDDVSFGALAPDIQPAESIGDIKGIEYFCQTTAGNQQPELTRRVTTNLLAPMIPTIRDETICRNVRSFALRYYDGSTWQTTWDSSQVSNVLPMAVEVTIEQGAQNETPRRTVRIIQIPLGQPVDTTSTSGGGA